MGTPAGTPAGAGSHPLREPQGELPEAARRFLEAGDPFLTLRWSDDSFPAPTTYYSLLVRPCGQVVLEIVSDAPPDEELVTSAFKKLAVRWHPDRNPDNVKEATQRFAEISAARDLLVDPPVNAVVEDSGSRAPPSGDPYPKSKHSQNLRLFEGDVSDDIDSGALGGAEAAALFESFGLWAVWKCNSCNAVCCRIRKNKYR